MKILTICPTFNRPELCAQMLKSWHNTIGGDNTMVLGLDISDPSLSAYPKDANRVTCKANSTITEVINSIWASNHDKYDFFHIINDDVLFHTPSYDKKMAYILEGYGGGIAYGNDLFQGQALPTFPFISASLCTTLGWLQHPSLNRYCGDTVWASIGKECGCLYYLGEVIIEHLHKLAGKGNTDIDMKVFQDDWHAYIKWAMTEGNLDSNRVKGILNGTS